jgi:hypothetical protein
MIQQRLVVLKVLLVVGPGSRALQLQLFSPDWPGENRMSSSMDNNAARSVVPAGSHSSSFVNLRPRVLRVPVFHYLTAAACAPPRHDQRS